MRELIWERRRAIERDAREARRSWRRLFGDPSKIALDVLGEHTPSYDDTHCSCLSVKEGDTYREHVVAVLQEHGMLRIPPHFIGEGW